MLDKLITALSNPAMLATATVCLIALAFVWRALGRPTKKDFTGPDDQ